MEGSFVCFFVRSFVTCGAGALHSFDARKSATKIDSRFLLLLLLLTPPPLLPSPFLPRGDSALPNFRKFLVSYSIHVFLSLFST
jgi:hypothetical protein